MFRKDIGELIHDLFLKQSKESWRFVLFILISMVPSAVVGLFFESTIAALFSGNLIVVGSLLLCTGVLLYFANRTPAESQPIEYLRKQLVIGGSTLDSVLSAEARLYDAEAKEISFIAERRKGRCDQLDKSN